MKKFRVYVIEDNIIKKKIGKIMFRVKKYDPNLGFIIHHKKFYAIAQVDSVNKLIWVVRTHFIDFEKVRKVL